jgi:hypothetical protein
MESDEETDLKPGTASGGDGKNGEGAGQGNPPPAESGGAAGGGAGQGGGQGGDPPKPPKVEFSTEQNAAIEEIVKRRLKQQEDAIKQAAETDAKKKAGEFQSLYETEHPLYEALKLEVEGLRNVVNNFLANELKALPPVLQKLNPQHSDPVKQLAWITTARVRVKAKVLEAQARAARLATRKSRSPRSRAVRPRKR